MEKFIQKLNEWGGKQIPFFFLIDYEKEKPFVCLLSETDKQNIFFNLEGITNRNIKNKNNKNFKLQYKKINYNLYSESFKQVIKELKYGNTYLLNLSFATKIKNDYSLLEIYDRAKSKYKLFFDNKFVCFSPETFIKIKGNKIYSYPMKGTIDANIQGAEKLILSDKKETFEHNTIVDLIRNDLSLVSTNIEVSKYRFIQKIKTNNKNLLQVSSEITGNLYDNWKQEIGSILNKILPAGSISGAPKEKTMEIISRVEKDKRGYYSGIFGIFDGQNLNSAILIRYIEKKNKSLFYRSGGGITALSKMKNEYEELNQKIYIPVD